MDGLGCRTFWIFTHSFAPAPGRAGRNPWLHRPNARTIPAQACGPRSAFLIYGGLPIAAAMTSRRQPWLDEPVVSTEIQASPRGHASRTCKKRCPHRP
ncbi:hypothetical protein GWL_26550 [Herbaspirillum sp. GW103]|nr:hypothetical protein GWL_26550 [Herbaspirillum sp. GW103]